MKQYAFNKTIGLTKSYVNPVIGQFLNYQDSKKDPYYKEVLIKRFKNYEILVYTFTLNIRIYGVFLFQIALN